MFEKSGFLIKVPGGTLIITGGQNVLSKMKWILLAVCLFPSLLSTRGKHRNASDGQTQKLE